MLDTFVKNRGETKTILHNNNHNDISKINWDAEYDGDKANVSLDFDTNGKKGHYDIELNNNDLAEILNIPTINSPIDKRLLYDFKRQQDRKNMRQYMVEIDEINPMLQKPMMLEPKILKVRPQLVMPELDLSREEMIQMSKIPTMKKITTPINNNNNNSNPFYTHFSSPLPNEELVIPLSIKNSKRKSHKSQSSQRNKKHHTYKVYRRIKSATPNSKSKSSRRTKRYSRKTF
jgi:hypothetical protein